MTTSLEIRKTIINLPFGESASLVLGDLPLEHAKDVALRFSRARKLPILILPSDPGVLALRRVTQTEANPGKYPEMSALKIGESHLYEVPPPMFQRIRIAASNHNKTGLVLFSCRSEAQGLRVTRHPLTAEEIAAYGLIEPTKKPAPAQVAQVPKVRKPTKYALERLATESTLRFDIPRTAHGDLRTRVTQYAMKHGLTLRCRVQDDGSMLVYPAPAPAQTQAAE